MCHSIPSNSMLFVIEGRFEVESCFVIIIIIIFMPPPLLKHSSHPQCGSAVVWCEATYVVTGVIAATVVVVTTVVASCPAGADRTAAIAGGENSAPRQATPPSGDGDLGDLGKQRRPQASNAAPRQATSGGCWEARKDGGDPPMDGVMKLEKPGGDPPMDGRVMKMDGSTTRGQSTKRRRPSTRRQQPAVVGTMRHHSAMSSMTW